MVNINKLGEFMNKKYLLSIAALVCISNYAIASDKYALDEAVVTASGFSQEIKEAPATINVITKKDLERKPYRDVAEAISDIPGVDISAPGKTGANNISIRGLGNGYVLVLVDGRRQGISGDIGPNGFGEVMNAFLPPISSIERIEVIKGPMSTLYGSEALGGVVNIITKKVSDEWGASFGLNTLINEDNQWGNLYGFNIYADGPLIENKLGATFRYAQSYREKSNVMYNVSSLERNLLPCLSPLLLLNYFSIYSNPSMPNTFSLLTSKSIQMSEKIIFPSCSLKMFCGRIFITSSNKYIMTLLSKAFTNLSSSNNAFSNIFFEIKNGPKSLSSFTLHSSDNKISLIRMRNSFHLIYFRFSPIPTGITYSSTFSISSFIPIYSNSHLRLNAVSIGNTP